MQINQLVRLPVFQMPDYLRFNAKLWTNIYEVSSTLSNLVANIFNSLYNRFHLLWYFTAHSNIVCHIGFQQPKHTLCVSEYDSSPFSGYATWNWPTSTSRLKQWINF